jgi:hypothetical protein
MKLINEIIKQYRFIRCKDHEKYQKEYDIFKKLITSNLEGYFEFDIYRSAKNKLIFILTDNPYNFEFHNYFIVTSDLVEAEIQLRAILPDIEDKSAKQQLKQKLKELLNKEI